MKKLWANQKTDKNVLRNYKAARDKHKILLNVLKSLYESNLYFPYLWSDVANNEWSI